MSAQIKRQRTVTTLGLPVRKELLVKSLLRLANETTSDRWSFIDEPIAEVAICGQGFMVPAVEPPRIRSPAQPRYISLVSGDERGSAQRPTLRDPIRPADLVALLDSVSSEVSRKQPAQSEPVPSMNLMPAEMQQTGAIQLAVTLYGLMRRGSQEVFRIEFGGNVLHVLPAAQTLLVRKPISDEALIRVFDAAGDMRITPLNDSQAQSLIADGARQQPIDWLLWRTALRAPRDRLLPMLPENARFSLRRWPDFGRLKHDQGHMRMAARLTTASLGIQQLANSLHVSMESARAFINACALCGLIEVHPATTPPVASVNRSSQVVVPSPLRPVVAVTASAPSRYAGIFKSIRTALGLETS